MQAAVQHGGPHLKRCHIEEEYGQEDWTYILTADLSIDTYWDNKKGNAVYGATEDRFYGIANGYGTDAYEKDEVVRHIFTIE